MSDGSALDEFRDAVSLRKDGRRLSLEGVLTGAALGIVLLYMLEDAIAATSRPQGGGPIDWGEPIDLGQFQAAVGSIPIQPLEDVAVGTPGGPVPGSSGAGDSGGDLNASAAALDHPALRLSQPEPMPGQRQNLAARGGELMAGPPRTRGGSSNLRSPIFPSEVPGAGSNDFRPQTVVPTQPTGKDPTDNPVPDPFPNAFPDPLPEPLVGNLPELMLVVVRTTASAGSRTLSGDAHTTNTAKQVGMQGTVLDLRDTGAPSLELRSERQIPGYAESALCDADLALITDHISLLNSMVLQGEGSDAIVYGANDFFHLTLLAAEIAKAEIQSRVLGMDHSQIVTGGGNDLLGLEAKIQLDFLGVGDSSSAKLSFDLLTQAMRDSAIAMGDGDDTLTINSGYYDTIDKGALSFVLMAPESQSEASDERGTIDFHLNARAIAMENSQVDMGSGNDRAQIFTRIDNQLAQDLSTYPKLGDVAIDLQRIGLLNSTILMGDGNDILQVNGSIINSTIDMGSGINSLVLENSVLGDSHILLGDSGSRLQINGSLGGIVSGGSGNDVFELRNLKQSGELDGGDGNDLLIAGSNTLAKRELLVLNGLDRGNLDGLRFREVENIALGGGNDITVMDLGSSLTGRLLGGAGLDRLDFSSWTLPVEVDLDRNSATGILSGQAGGLNSFEQIVGGIGNDVLSASGSATGLNGSDGEDRLFLRWSPWLSSSDEGLQLKGGTGRDLFVISGLEQPIPVGWDGRHGLPDLTDIDLSKEPGIGIGLTDRIGWIRDEILPDGSHQQSYQELTPSGLNGLGDVKLLPIAPLEQLLSGMSDGTHQLAIALDSTSDFGSQLVLLGSQGKGTSQPVAGLPSLLVHQGVGVSGSSGSTP